MGIFKNIYYSLLPRAVSRPLRKQIQYFITKYFRGASFALGGLDKKLEKYLNYDNGYYVELGANDGISQSNTLYFEIKRGWRGVLIEPSPINYRYCLCFRGARNDIHCNACVSFECNLPFIEMVNGDLMSISRGLESDLDSEVEHLGVVKRHMSADMNFVYGAKAKTLTQILDESKAPNIIDLLSLDVEGAEIEVIKGLDFNKYKFKYMVIECRNISNLEMSLEGLGYKRVDQLSHHDYLFKNTTV
tara:strand:- start:538 stop:1275 length:738 start_codon:yes stop_codon:yes gene_type:complete